MWNTKLCLGTGNYFGADEKTQLKLFRDTGFEAFFTGWDGKKDLCDLRKYADELGLVFQSVHAPYIKSADMWKTGPKADAAKAELLRCVEDTAAARLGMDVFLLTDCLINNDIASTSSKNKKAKELGIPIITEDDFIRDYLS